MGTYSRQLLTLLAGLLALSRGVSLAQVTGATLTGTVMDQQHAVIAGARVSVKNVATGTVREVTTNGEGLYLAPNLLPGPYTVSFSAAGFGTNVRSGIQLTVGAQEVVNIELVVGNVTQTVEVKDSGSGIETTSSSLSAVVDGTTARELPLNGRDWTQLATLQPGIAQIRTQPDASGLNNRGNRGFGTQLTISGGRPQQNNYRLDGISINDYANSSPGSTLGLSLGADAIQEFSVVSSNYSASYGLTSGGVVNAITRSGTNQWHGSVYEFLRNDAFDAKSFFDSKKLPLRRNQFGATMGGPIRKDRSFIFGDYEGLRQSLTTTASANVLSPAARSGRLTTRTVSVDSKVAPYLNFWPAPNGAVRGDLGIYTFPAKAVTPENFFTVRADHKLSRTDDIHGTYLFDNATTTLPDGLNVLLNSNKTRRQMASIEESHIFSRAFINVVRGGVNRVSAATLATAPGANPMGTDQQFGVAPGLYAPVIGAGALTQFQGGLNGTSFGNYGFTTWQLYDDAFWTKGIHSFKFGFAFERIDSNLLLTANPNGVFRFTTLEEFLTNKPASFQVQLSGATPRGLRQSVYGAYMDDDIRVKPNLTVNLGLRYEPSSVPSEVTGKLGNLRWLASPALYAGDPYFHNSTLRNFEPRLGFAWDPFKKGKTSVRGGGGMFDVLPMTYQFNLMSAFSAPSFVMASSTDKRVLDQSFPNQAYTLVTAPAERRLRAAYAQFDPPRNYVFQWNLNIQQELLPSLTLMIGYVGNHGVHQPVRSTDANSVQPTVTTDGLIWPCRGALTSTGFCNRPGGTVINPAFGQIDGQEWSGSSRYDAMLVHVKKQLRHGFQLLGSFTWAKGVDTSSSVIAGGPFLNSISGQLLNYPLRGLSDFDIRRNLVVHGLWDVPAPKVLPSVAKVILGSWELGGIFHVSDGLPFTPLVGGDPLGLGTTSTFAIPDRVSGPGCTSLVNPGNVNQYINLACFAFPSPSTRLGTAGRNSLIGPGLVNMDFSLMKNFPLHFVSEAAKLQFRAEIFNLTNHPNFAAPLGLNQLFGFVSAVCTGTPNCQPTPNEIAMAERASRTPTPLAGTIRSTSSSSREIQLALKLTF